MDDLNEMARLHSAGATVRHTSPFDKLPVYRNETDLSKDFIKKWAVPYYMAIASYGDDNWIESIKAIKSEITPAICLSLLGDFNWRTRLVGSYFAAVKGYTDLIDITGTHLLKSEVCCVGHIYALTLAFFNDEKSIQYLRAYLDYYLTKSDLYFNQEYVMEAMLFLDKENGTHNFTKYLDSWTLFEQERKKIAAQSAERTAKMVEELKGASAAADYVKSLVTQKEKKPEHFSTTYFDKQIAILRNLNQYSH